MIVTVDMALALGVFFLVVGFSRYISLGSLAAAVSVPLIMIIRENIFNVDIRGYHTILPFAILLALFVIYTHRTNIERLLQGSERKVSFSKKKNA